MKHGYQLKQVMTTGCEARYSANGKRVSKARYEEIFQRGNMGGEVDCFQSTCKQLGNGRLRRTNYVSVRY